MKNYKWLKYLEIPARGCLLTGLVVAGIMMGTALHDVMHDDPLKDAFIYTEEGNDLVVFTPSLYGKHNKYYDAGQGIDSLWIRIKASEYERPDFRSDLIRFHYFILNKVNPNTRTGSGPEFRFHSIGLTVRNVENIILERIAEK